jgi:hypothetical protein
MSDDLARITVELTRRREFNQASPDQLSYETRSRRSRPTIRYAAPSSTECNEESIEAWSAPISL